jgi:hypothetical protein
MGRTRKSSAFFRSRLGHSQKHCITPVSRDDVVFSENSCNDCPTASELTSERLNGIPGTIEPNEIIDIKNFFYHGYVYDVQSISTLLICNDILTSNCRCCVICRRKR